MSAVVFPLAYRFGHLDPRVSSLAAFLSGACVNFVANRFWAWARRERQGLGRDVASYAMVAVSTALLATGSTTLAEWYARRAGMSDNVRTLFVEAAYFATYATTFVLKFAILDRLVFASRDRLRQQA